MEKLNILLVSPLKSLAGTELSTLTIATQLKQRGHQVYLICNSSPFTSRFQELDIKIGIGAIHLRSLTGMIKGTFDIRRFLAQNDIDIIHLQIAFTIPMVFLALRTIRKKTPVVWHCRGIHTITYTLIGMFNFLVDFAIVNCNSERNRLLDRGFPLRKTKTIYNCPNIQFPRSLEKDLRFLEKLNISSNTYIVGTASRLEKDRGVSYFLDAARKVIENISNVIFIIAGDGPLREKLKHQAKRLGVEKQVYFLGPVKGMEKFYASIDILVNPVLHGMGVGNINIEAMCFAKPVIASGLGGISEAIIDGTTGILVPPKNSQKLAEAIMYLLENGDVAKRMGEAGRERVRNYFTPERLVSELEEAYFSLLPGKAKNIVRSKKAIINETVDRYKRNENSICHSESSLSS